MASFHPATKEANFPIKRCGHGGLSQSFAQPSFNFFEMHFTDVSESGYLHKRNFRGQWEKFWFALEDGVLYWLPLKPPSTHVFEARTSAGHLSMDKAASICTDSKHQNTFEFKLASRSILLRADNKDDRNKWMHSFHLCIAGLISRLIVNRRRTLSSGSYSPSPNTMSQLTRSGSSLDGSPVMPFGRRSTNKRDDLASSPSPLMEPVQEIEIESLSLSKAVSAPIPISAPTSAPIAIGMASKRTTQAIPIATKTTGSTGKWLPPQLRGSSSPDKWVPPHKRNEGVSNPSSSTGNGAAKWVPPHLRGNSGSSTGSSSAAKWVPPHLRNSDSSISSSDSSSSTAKWVPPHLRGNTTGSNGSSTAKWVPPHLRGNSGTSSGSSTAKWVPPHRRGEAASSRSSPDRCSDSYDFDTDEDFLFEMDMPSSTPTPVSASSNTANQTTSKRSSPQLTQTATSSHVGVTSMQGPRDKMEDFYVSLPTFGCEDQSFYAVYDGHCGTRAAEYAADKLHTYIQKHPMFKSDCKRAVLEACAQVDDEFVELARKKNIYDGTTAVIALLIKSRAIIATIGDSYCILCRDGKAVELSAKLTPGNPSERARIEAAGGWITEERELYLSRLHHMELEDPFIAKQAEKSVRWMTTHRVNGELSVSRALGDPDYKGKGMSEYMWAFPKDHSKKFSADLVLAVPDIKDIEFQSKDEFFILACDGLWDVLVPQDAVDIISESFEKGESAQEASLRLTRIALKLGTADNVTIIVVKLNQRSEQSETR